MPAPRAAAESRTPAIGGASAQREFERRSQRRAADIRARHPRVGGLILAFADDPSHTKVWSQGAEGERKVAATLDALDGVVALHDRRLRRGSRANIDHLAVTPGGIWVVDAKTHHGKLEIRRSGGLFSPPVSRLYIRGRDQTSLVLAVQEQVRVVRDAVAERGLHVEVRGALCFVGTELPGRAAALDGVPLIGRRTLAKLLAHPGPLGPDGVAAIAAVVDEAFPPA